MIHKKTRNVKLVFAFMVPLTCVAFYLSHVLIDTVIVAWQPFDIVSLLRVICLIYFHLDWFISSWRRCVYI